MNCRALFASMIALPAASGCAPLAVTEGRASKSSLGCMRAALQSGSFAELPDVQAHCVAAGLIARRCSTSESMLASIGKEIRDALGPGDAQWSDLQADRKGLRCAQTADDEQALLACCARMGKDESGGMNREEG